MTLMMYLFVLVMIVAVVMEMIVVMVVILQCSNIGNPFMLQQDCIDERCTTFLDRIVLFLVHSRAEKKL